MRANPRGGKQRRMNTCALPIVAPAVVSESSRGMAGAQPLTHEAEQYIVLFAHVCPGSLPATDNKHGIWIAWFQNS